MADPLLLIYDGDCGFCRFGVGFGVHKVYPLLARYRWLLGRLATQSDRLVTCG